MQDSQYLCLNKSVIWIYEIIHLHIYFFTCIYAHYSISIYSRYFFYNFDLISILHYLLFLSLYRSWISFHYKQSIKPLVSTVRVLLLRELLITKWSTTFNHLLLNTRAEFIWWCSCILPTRRVFFFGSWHDNHFIWKLFRNITTF